MQAALGRALAVFGVCAWLVIAAGCSSDTGDSNSTAGTAVQDVPAPPGALTGTTPATPTGTQTGTIGSDPAQTPGTAGGAGTDAAGGAAPGAGTDPAVTDPATQGAPPAGDTAGAAGAAAPMPQDTTNQDTTGQDPPAGDTTDTPAGPDDGDPSAPIVSTPDVACGGPGGFFGAANFDIGGREMIVTYPCNKHAGAPMTFFLNLHGTTPVSQHFYQHGYFAAHELTESHNLIVVTPSSVVEQWGNGDGGQDEPHLMEIIDWVYATFDGDGKFDIRQMWVGGHSWGAMYTTTFVCKPELADKVRGAVIMSGIGRNPACADRISVISTAAEDDIGPVVDQGTVPASHGCDAATMSMIGNNEETHWPNCDPGYVHSNYFMLGKTHTSSIDAEVVARIADLINVARP
ncbi:MAG: alpha/beta hydrolase [Myxococcales bacterium]